MNLQQSETMLHFEANIIPSEVAEFSDLMRPNTPFAMLKQLSAVSEGFASASTLTAMALESRRQVIIAANMNHDANSLSHLSCWKCMHDEQGIDLVPIDVASSTSSVLDAEPWVAKLIGDGTKGDALVVCDPWGDDELLCWALRMASRRGIATIAITIDQPNLLAVLAHHSIRVPVTAPFRREFVITVLRHLVQTAGVGVIPAQRRATGPLRELHFD